MISQQTLESVKELLAPAQSVLVLTGGDPKFDHLAAALALTQGLKAAGKDVTFATPDDLSEVASDLQESELIQQKLGRQNLSVSFPYNADAVDKVSYHISDDNQKFYLVVKPQKGHPPLDAKQVTFDYTGADAELIFLVGVHQFDALEHLYEGYEELYEQATVVSINTFETAIGAYKLDISGTAAMSQSMAGIMSKLDLPISGEVATNLLMGIEDASENYASALTNADTFEMVAWLMRNGARRIKRKANGVVEVAVSGTVGKSNGKVLKTSSKTPSSLSQAMSKKVEIQASSPKPKSNLKKKKKKSPPPGGLDYQPGAESGVGQG
jgi:hypothetical protein